VVGQFEVEHPGCSAAAGVLLRNCSLSFGERVRVV